MKNLLALFALVFFSIQAFSQSQGLVIHATEIGIGKFHRFDNSVHPYQPNNVWLADVLPDKVGFAKTPLVYTNPDNSVTIYFSTIHELFTSMVDVAKKRQQKISVLNIHGHGMPGGMWFPKNKFDKYWSPACRSWRKDAVLGDKTNYDHYYTALTKDQIKGLRKASLKEGTYACVQGKTDWEEEAAEIPNIKSYFADDAQIHFASCLVGLGPVGDAFTLKIAKLFLSGSKATVQSLTNFGLGDWSMPEGMGFWDYVNNTQLDRDNKNYTSHKQDREIMQKGTVRVVFQKNGTWTSALLADQDFMFIGFQAPAIANDISFNTTFQGVKELTESEMLTDLNPEAVTLPDFITIPGTGVSLPRIR